MEQLAQKLRDKGVVLTHQRLAIFRFLIDNRRSHPTATEIFRHLRKEYPTISQATVYSTLELLKKMGQVRELSIRGDQACFDTVNETHYHLFCKRCQRILDVEIPCPSLGAELVEGHRVEEVQLYLYGICSDCLDDPEGGDGGDKRTSKKGKKSRQSEDGIR